MKKLLLFFAMTEQERRGFLALLFVIFLISLFPFAYSIFWREPPATAPAIAWILDHNHVGSDADAFATDPTIDRATDATTPGINRKAKGALFFFDPNNLPAERWRALGFSDKQIAVIKNYEAKGGKFYRPEDVAKIYVISAEQFSKIAPYLQFPEKPSKSLPEKQYAREQHATALLQLDLNQADTSALVRLNGIGPVLSARIVKFRDNLGGFHTVEQLKEVYGLSTETYEHIKAQLLVAQPRIKQLAINRLSEEELAAHPYISYKVARLIVRYREQHGNFDYLADLRNIYTLDADFLRKIGPYLNFNEE